MFHPSSNDYFSNWVEAEAFKNVMNFLWKHIFCRFGIPRDYRTQFNNPKVEELCERYGVRLNLSPIYYPKSNCMAEATNKVITNNLKKNLDDKKRNYLKELPKVLWAQRTIQKDTIEESHFSLVYGTEAVISRDARLPT